MSTDVTGFGKDRRKHFDLRKHLDLIQGVVNRLAGASFQIKGWTVTTVTALLGLVVAVKIPTWVAFVGLIPALIFWFLDAYYVQQERLFRALYNDAINPATTVPVFSMDVGPYTREPRNRYWAVWGSRTIWPLHTAVVVLTVLFACVQFVFPWPPAEAKPANCGGEPAKAASAEPGTGPSGHGVEGEWNRFRQAYCQALAPSPASAEGAARTILDYPRWGRRFMPAVRNLVADGLNYRALLRERLP